MKCRQVFDIALAIGLLMFVVLGFMPKQAGAASIVTSVFVADQDSNIKLEAATTNFGTATILDSFTNGSTEDRRVVMSFDLSSLLLDPLFGGITSATLRLGVPVTDANPPFDGVHDVQRLQRDFVELQVTWNEYSTGNAWQIAGGTGALDSVQIATGIESGEVDPAIEWANGGLDVLAATNTWVTLQDTIQLGFMVYHLQSNGVARTVFGSIESLDGPGPGPVLVIQSHLIPEPGSAVLLGLSSVALMLLRRSVGPCHAKNVFENHSVTSRDRKGAVGVVLLGKEKPLPNGRGSYKTRHRVPSHTLS